MSFVQGVPSGERHFSEQRTDWFSRLLARFLCVGLFRIPILCTEVVTAQTKIPFLGDQRPVLP